MKNVWKLNVWNLLGVIFALFFLAGCLGHEANTTGAVSEKDTSVTIDSGGGQQIIYAPTYISTANEQSATQKTDNDPTSTTEGNLGLNGGSASKAAKGATATATATQTLTEVLAGKVVDAIVSPGESVKPTVPVKPETPVVTHPAATTSEKLRYADRHNGDRPTWYGKKDFSEYPSPLHVVIDDCYDESVEHDGVRYESDGLILKQSSEPGRGMAVVYSSTCDSKTATVSY